MDFRDTPAEATFRKEVRDWFQANVPRDLETVFRDDEAAVERSRAWQRALHEGGWAGLSWPKEYGGRGVGLMEQVIFSQEFMRAKAPPMLNVIGLGMAGPTIIAHGTEEQKHRYLDKILSGEEIWCQGFSEPGAGSDLAGLRTTAVPEGDAFIVNGQKVWTTLAHLASWIILLARTDPTAPKHKGITYLLVDMRSPGVEVRPLKQITGHSEFNETFFTDVRVPRENVLGEINDGWRVAMTTLLHERGTLGFALATQAEMALNDALDTAREVTYNGRPAIDDPLVRQRLAQAHVEIQSMRLNNYRALTSVMRTGIPGPEGSLGKLLWSESLKRLYELMLEIEGPAGLVEAGPQSVAGGMWQYRHLRSRAHSIEAGTSEILRNIIAERVLGLPKHK